MPEEEKQDLVDIDTSGPGAEIELEEPKEKKCSICLDDFNDKDLVYLLECKHLFHKICIDEWLTKYNYNCPICRKKLGKGEPIIE